MRLLRGGLIGLLCLAGAVAAVNLFAGADFHGGGLSFATRIRILVPGETRLSLPPLGVASARTHHAPVRIELELRGLNPSLLKALGTETDVKEKMLARTTELARAATIKTAFLALVLSGLGGLAAALLLRRGKPLLLAAAFLLGGLGVGTLLAWTYLDYDQGALKQPRYEGMLESAPWVMSILTDSFDGLARLGQGFEVMARNLPRLSHQGEAGTPMADLGEDLRVLHVSDLHNNKAAYDLIGSLVQSFAVNLVIDTGDLTDYGTAVESELAAGIGHLRVPYVFVPGNHDSPEVIDRLRRIPNVITVRGRIVRAAGLRILGAPDPAAAGPGAEVPADELMRQAAEGLAGAWEGAAVKPDLVAAHNRRMLSPLIGRAGVVLHGHDHRASLRRIRGTLVEDAGTSGAAGLRGLAGQEDVPYTLDLQYWRRDAAGQYTLAAVDTITVDGLNGKLQVARTLTSPNG